MIQNVDTVLVIDWPNRDVPEALALAGFHVYVGGPGPEDYSVYEVSNGQVDAVWCVRGGFGVPKRLLGSGKGELLLARQLVQVAGLNHVSEP